MNQPSFEPLKQSAFELENLKETMSSLQQVWVSDVMTPSPMVVGMQEKIETALILMQDNQVRHLPVIDADQNIQGIVSDKDLLGSVFHSKPWILQERVINLRAHHTVREVMTATPEVIHPDSTLLEAGEMLLDYKISCLPVVEGSRVVGILTESDFVKLICGRSQNE